MIEQALYEHLAADAAVSALAGTRIYPVRFPQAPTYPAMTYGVVAEVTDITHDGPSGLVMRRFQLDLYAETYGALLSLKRAVKSSLSGFSGMMGNSPGFEVQAVFADTASDQDESATERSGPRIFRSTIDFETWFTEE